MNTIRYLKSKIKISEVFKIYDRVTGNNDQKFASCPFHPDHTPSVSIRDNKGSYKCFSCSRSGDIFSLVGDMENLTFPESVDWIMDHFSIEPPERAYRDQVRGHIAKLESKGKNKEALEVLLKT
jgi:DNA primase